MADPGALPGLSVLELPGVLGDAGDPCGALHALGGEGAVHAAVHSGEGSEAPALTLDLESAGSTFSNITSSTHAPPAHVCLYALCYDPRTDDTRVLGSVRRVTRFDTLADFAFHPAVPPTPASADPAHVAAARMLDAVDRFVAAQPPADGWMDRLRPRRFSRVNAPVDGYWFKQSRFNRDGLHVMRNTENRRGQGLIDDGRSDVNRLDALRHRVPHDVTCVPIAPHPNAPVVNGRNRHMYERCCQILHRLFEERPVWLRRALREGVPRELRTCFKSAIWQFAYIFKGTGPFHLACVRYGYDPRRDSEAVKWQTMEIRTSHPVVVEAARREREKREQEEKERVRFVLPEEYVLRNVPTRRVILVQMCDVWLQAFRNLFDKVNKNAVYDYKYGYLSERDYTRLLRLARVEIIQICTDYIGMEKANELIAKYRNTGEEGLLKKVRVRHSLGSVMHPQVAVQHTAEGEEQKEQGDREREEREQDNIDITYLHDVEGFQLIGHDKHDDDDDDDDDDDYDDYDDYEEEEEPT